MSNLHRSAGLCLALCLALVAPLQAALIELPSANPSVIATYSGVTGRTPVAPGATLLCSDRDSDPRPNNAPLDPSLKGFVPIPGTTTLFKVSGYAKADLIYDDRRIGHFDDFVTSSIPVRQVDGANLGAETSFHIRQSRLRLEARRNTPLGPLRILNEHDLFAAAGATGYHVRHMYCQVGNWLAGRSFSNFIDVDSVPDTIDFEGPPSSLASRQTQIRHTFDLDHGLSVALSLEEPESEVVPPPGATAVERLPDGTFKLRLNRDWGHLQLASVFRRLGWDDGVSLNTSTLGAGACVSGAIRVHHKDTFQFQVAAGQGISHYVNDLGGLDCDAAFDPAGQIIPLKVFAPFIGYQHFWTRSLRSTAVVSRLWLENAGVQAENAYKTGGYESLNLVWSPETYNIGVEVLHGQHGIRTGQSAEALRVQLAIQVDLID